MAALDSGDPRLTAWFEAHPHPNVLEPMHDPGTKAYVALLDGDDVVATAYVQPRPMGFGQVGGVLTAPDRRGEGLGTAIMDALHDKARELGVRRLVLGAYRRPPDVAPFYRRLGYRVWVPFIPGTATRGVGPLARLLAAVFRVEAGPDAIRLMVKRLR